MAALTADRKPDTIAGTPRYRSGKVAASTTIYKGAALCRNSSGYLVPAAATIGLKFVGWAAEKVDNSAGANGDKSCKYFTGQSVKMKNSGTSAITQAHIGDLVYAEDDQTVRATPGAAGVILGYAESLESDGVYVYGAPEVAPGGDSGEDVARVSDTQTAGGIPVVYTFAIPDAATADYDRVVDAKFEILDVIVQKRGGAGAAGNTIRVKNAADNVTDAIDTNDADQTISRPTTIDDAFSTIAAGGTLRVTSTKSGGNAACLVTVIGVLRA
jgi:hypothetical protein